MTSFLINLKQIFSNNYTLFINFINDIVENILFEILKRRRRCIKNQGIVFFLF